MLAGGVIAYETKFQAVSLSSTEAEFTVAAETGNWHSICDPSSNN